MNESLEPKTATEQPAPQFGGRLTSLDVFRGATVAAMMLVNNPGDWKNAYKPLLHAEWHGWTFTDVIFPFFLWIVGVAIPLSVANRLEHGQSRRQLFLHALRRAGIIFALGLFLNSFSYLIDGSVFRDGFIPWLVHYATNVRIPGVLQRIAICYLVATLIFLITEKPVAHEKLMTRDRIDLFRGVRGRVAAIVSCLVIYWLLMALWPVPGYGRGNFEKEGNFAGYVDNLVLNGPVIGTHVWRSAKTWDPEGLVSTLPAIATCLFGVLAGQLLRSRYSPERKTLGLVISGVALVALGQILNVWLPINKSLWTSSYAVFMAGLASLCFAACYWVGDVRGWRKWSRPFAVYGVNALTVFVLAGVLGRLAADIKVTTGEGQKVALKTLLYGKFFAPFASPDTAPFLGFMASPWNASLLWAVMFVALLYAIAWLMHLRGWILKV